MVLQGDLWKDGKFWTIEVPELDVATQGTTRKEAFAMMRDAIESLVHKRGFKVRVRALTKNTFVVDANDDSQFIAFFLKRQREIHGLTVRDMTARLEYKSVNAYAQYEQGKVQPTLKKIQAFLAAMNPKHMLRLRLSVVEV